MSKILMPGEEGFSNIDNEVQEQLAQQYQAEMFQALIQTVLENVMANILNTPVVFAYLDDDDKLVDKDKAIGKIPQKAHQRDSCYDAVSPVDVMIPARSTVTVGLGIGVALPSHVDLLILPRSGLAAKHGITVLNTPGMVDGSYMLRQLKVILHNTKDTDYQVKAGDRIAQLRFGLRSMNVIPREFEGDQDKLDEVHEKVERKGGLGSSG